jgi:hypothetical protein
MNSKIKRYVLAVFLFILVLGSQVACFEEGDNTSTPKQTVISSNTGGDWRRCNSLTCTYKVKVTKDIKTGIKGVRINLATAIPLGGNWE